MQRGPPSAVKEGAQAAMQPPKGTIGFPSGSGVATFFITHKNPNDIFAVKFVSSEIWVFIMQRDK